MGILSRILNVFKAEQPAPVNPRPILPSYVSLSDLLSTKTYEAFVNAYTSWVFSCVDKISKTVAAMDYGLYTVQKQGKAIPAGSINRKSTIPQGYEKVRIFDHPFLALLNKPNPVDTRTTFWMSIMCRLELFGSCGIYLPRNRLGIPAEAWVLPLRSTAELKVIPDPKMIIKGYRYTDGSLVTDFTPEEILWIRYPSPKSPFEGMSPLKAQSTMYDIGYFLDLQQRTLLGNNAVPGMTLTTEQRLTKAQVEEITELVNTQYKGTSKTGKTMVLHSGLKKDGTTTMTSKDLMVNDLYKIVRDQMLSAYGVPAGKLGLVEDVNRANMDALDKFFYQETIKPRIQIIEEAFEARVLPLYDENLMIDFVMPEFAEREYDLKQDNDQLDRFVVTINEVRTRRGLPPVAWGNMPFMPFTVSQMGDDSSREDSGSGSDDQDDGKKAPAGEVKTFRKGYTKEARERIWKAFAAKQESWEGLFEKTMRKYFRDQESALLGRLNAEAGKIKGQFAGWGLNKVKAYIKGNAELFNRINISKKEQEAELVEAVTPVYLSVLKSAGDDRSRDLSTVVNAKHVIQFNVNDPAVKQWLGDRLKMFSKEVTGTTFDDIAAVLRTGFGEGMSVTQISDNLRSLFTSYEQYRSLAIARTETAASMNFADLDAVSQAGLEDRLLKTWISSRDENTRDSHIAAELEYQDGIPVDDNFDVGGDLMEAPGNGTDPAENINCRCTLAYIKREE